MVALVSDGVSDYAMKLLQADGWIVEKVTLLANPNQVWPMRFWGVCTNLKIFSMTNYMKVVYLNADTIVVKSIEDIFKCSKFCANLKHSERLNTGNVRVQLRETLPGTGGGGNPNDALLVKFLFLLPFCALLFCYYRSCVQTQDYSGSLCRSSLCRITLASRNKSISNGLTSSKEFKFAFSEFED